MDFDHQLLMEAVGRIPESAWSLASTYRDTQVHHGYRRVVLASSGQRKPYAELFDFVWDGMPPVWDANLSLLEPGGFIVPHRDAGPWRERWQIPIQPAGVWYGPGTFEPRAGMCFLARHWEPHAVANHTNKPRIHLVVDRDVLVDQTPLPFATFPVPADMADLIERSLL